MENSTADTEVQRLQKSVQILTRKLERSERDRARLEANNEKTEALLKRVIADLQASKETLETRSQELETALQTLKYTQTQLIEAEKMSALGVMVAGIAHEINNPVSFIQGNLPHAKEYAYTLLKLLRAYQAAYPQPPSSLQDEIDAVDLPFVMEDFPRLLDSMGIGTTRIRDIVVSLRTFSHLDEADLKTVDLHEGIESTLLLLRHRLKAEGRRPAITIVKAYGDLPQIHCYASKLNQVFMNLLVNAIDALEDTFDQPTCQREPQIQIRTTTQADWVIIQIADNGIGMNDDVKAKLFDPFFTTKSIGRGTGLGLAISYQVIMEQHHGKLSCQSAPGVGSVFTIELPMNLGNA